jgi:hypothetical protein
VAEGGLWIAKGASNLNFRIYRYVATEGTQARCGVPGSPNCVNSTDGATSAPILGGNSEFGSTLLYVPANASPIQAGVGVGIAMGVIALADRIEAGKIVFLRPEPPRNAFDGRVVRQ